MEISMAFLMSKTRQISPNGGVRILTPCFIVTSVHNFVPFRDSGNIHESPLDTAGLDT